MKRFRYTEEQIAFALKQAELGTPVPEVCRKPGTMTRAWGAFGFSLQLIGTQFLLRRGIVFGNQLLGSVAVG